MRSLRSFSVIAFAAAAVTGCDSTSPDGIRVIATLDKTSLSLSDTAAVTLQVINVGLGTVRGTHPNNYGICNRAFRVYKGEREVSVQTGFCAAASISNTVWFNPIDLGFGAAVTIRDAWDPASSTLDGAPIGPGTYTLVGIYHADDEECRSAPVTITVTQ